MKPSLRRFLTLIVGGTIFCVGASARADWNINDPYKWLQLPDLSTSGKDVKDMATITLADDWRCTSIDPITDVHIWGSWLGDIKPPDMGVVQFRLGIWSDVPATGTAASHPGIELWHTVTTPTAYQIWSAATTEEFIAPNGTILGSDTEVWQYNFFNLKDENNVTFVQQGTAANPVVYWLSVQVVSTTAGTFGWKTSTTNNIDDAAYRLDDQSPWIDLHDLQTTKSLDLAFVITTPEPTSVALLGLGALMLCRRGRKS
jgi:hypothetical protein